MIEMDASDVVVLKSMRMTCIECEEMRDFAATDGSVEGGEVVYGCEECGHEAKLLL